MNSGPGHPDLLTGCAERLWPPVVAAGWTSIDKTRRQHVVEPQEGEHFSTLRLFLACCCFCFSVTFEPLTPQTLESLGSHKKTDTGEEDIFDELCSCWEHRNIIPQVKGVYCLSQHF